MNAEACRAIAMLLAATTPPAAQLNQQNTPNVNQNASWENPRGKGGEQWGLRQAKGAGESSTSTKKVQG